MSYAPHYGDPVEAGTDRLTAPQRRRLRRTILTSYAGNMMRALAFADEEAITRWGGDRRIHRLTGSTATRPVPAVD
ncbi:hypothetical protein MTP10_06685 [Nonomuraea sp. 3-1Str]|uniref:hypothetical protein n=1 Tax=Nonomuraea sp. 3-1Str TaxID=2929801 RepID=UPI002854E687|nr:hypothetical protein [Nonomuraea sp. 3-1Str]MDR8408419.1 hypothetical protein [Nonomuraea sp. 3-1Str]